jgi:alkylhydroperoxidase family enzyme
MLGRSVGIGDEEMAGMAEPETVGTFDETDRLVLRYAEQSTRQIRIDDELYAALAASFDERQIIELAMTVGLAALVNRVHATFLTDLDPHTRAAVGSPSCPIGR